MSRRRSREKERNWSPIRAPGEEERYESRHQHRRSEDIRDKNDRKHGKIKLKRSDTKDEHNRTGLSKEKRKRKWKDDDDRIRYDYDCSDDDKRDLSSSKRKRRHRAQSRDLSQSRDRSQSQDKKESLELVIIGKSRAAGEFCVLGYDGNHIYRPVNFSTGSLFWHSDRFEVGKMYRFFLNNDDRSFKKLSFHPHRHNDVNVTDYTENIHDREKAKSLIKKLIDNAKSRMDFQGVMERKFVVEDTECPSACLYRCSSRDVELYRSRVGKQRVSVAGFDFPFAGIYSDIRKTFDDYDRNAVVVLSLTRPFGGFSDRVFNPKRCYILVVGLFSY